MRKAIRLARAAEESGNLPIGAVITLDGEVIARGMNSIWRPETKLSQHAEMQALRAVPLRLWPRSREMTIYTTLEPCLMCAGAILLHHLGRLVYGSSDPFGGVGLTLRSLPPYFQKELSHVHWTGPALTSECDPLYQRIIELEAGRGVDMV